MPLFFITFPSYSFARISSMKLIIILLLSCLGLASMASSKPSLEITVTGIPQGQQTLFVPIKIDTMIIDFDKVALEGLSSQNILAVASSSKDKVGPGIGLLKLDEEGLPETIELKVLLKEVGRGETPISVLMVANEPALLSKGAVIDDVITVSINGDNELNVTEEVKNGKKKLIVDKSKLTLNITRPAQKEETIFVPIIFDGELIDLDETFGHAIIAPGIAAKSFSSSSLQEGGPGIEIVLSAVAPENFTIDLDLIPKKVGSVKVTTALPQKGHTAIVRGPVVNISPAVISVASGG